MRLGIPIAVIFVATGRHIFTLRCETDAKECEPDGDLSRCVVSVQFNQLDVLKKKPKAKRERDTLRERKRQAGMMMVNLSSGRAT